MPLLLLFVLALTAGATVGILVWRYPRVAAPAPAPALETARKVGEAVGKHPRLRRILDSRLDPETATGLALTVALVLAIGGGLLLAVLAYLVRTNSHLIGIDSGIAKWGNRHATATSTRVLNDLTQLGSVYVVVVALVLAAVETIRQRSVWVIAFIASVMVGEEILTLSVKDLAHRVRPSFNPAAATLGPSFPSGHSATAAALYAGVALVLARKRSPQVRALLAGGAAGIAVGVATSRVMLDVHWLSDVIAGLAFGWAWFSICAVAFGGRFLTFGAPLKKAEQVAEALPPSVDDPALDQSGAPAATAP